MCLDESVIVSMIGEKQLVVCSLDSSLVFLRKLEPGVALLGAFEGTKDTV
jgi:hypothetical protein